jgi:hypothetical protein
MEMRLILVSALFCITSVYAQVQAGAVFSGDGLKSFYLAVGNYYHVPEREVIVIRERSIPPEEIPVVLFISQRANVMPGTIIDLRLRGTAYWDIALRYRVDPKLFYFNGGPPYGKAWGHYKKTGKLAVLRDAEIVDGVNCHFLAAYHGVSPEIIWTERGKGKNYVVVAQDFRGKGKGKNREDDFEKGNGGGKGKGKGKGWK